MRPVMEVTKHYENERLVKAFVTIYHHNRENRVKATRHLGGYHVTRQEFPEGRQMIVTFADDGTVASVTPRWDDR